MHGSRALDAEDAADGLFDLAAALGAKQSLAEIGMREEGLDRAADLAVESPYLNPTPLTRSGRRALLDDAFHGRRPSVAATANLPILSGTDIFWSR